MFTPLYIQLKYWFYPTGNTPAVNLFRDTPTAASGQANTINVLLLACGDPRNVLFSLWNKQGSAEKCPCHRNLTSDRRDVWNIFYHLFVPDRALAILQEHARCLLRASESWETWNSSPFGCFIGFLSKDSLASIRKFWISYSTEHECGQFEKKARNAISERSQEISEFTAMHGVRATGPFWIDAVKTMAHTYREFWKTGVVGGNAEDLADLGNGGLGLVNPMFAASSAPPGDYAVHYGTEPLLGFHVAEAFSNNPESTQTARTGVNSHVVNVAKTQFKAWCHSFKQYADNGTVRLEMFSGEAIGLCYELQLQIALRNKVDGLVRAYVQPWTLRPLRLESTTKSGNDNLGSFTLYNIIDSSNLSDHVGLINVLSATIPLLRKSSSSILYHESLLKASETIEKSLSDVL
ncbi:MAG: hypothetical protein Q9195_009512 [Heterodermia aff. obscurata]